MSPYVVFSLGLIASFAVGLWTSGSDPFTASALAAFGAISLIGLAVIFKTAPHALPRLRATYIVNAALVCLAVGIAQARVNVAAAGPRQVSVYFSGTCETLIALRDGRDAQLFYDGTSFSYIRHEDITAMSPEPGCRKHPATTEKDLRHHG
jgi:hypothetical protein